MHLTFRQKLIALAIASKLDRKPISGSTSCEMERRLAKAVDHDDNDGKKITSKTISNVFSGKSEDPRSDTKDAIEGYLNSQIVFSEGEFNVPNEWSSMADAKLLKTLKVTLEQIDEFKASKQAKLTTFFKAAKRLNKKHYENEISKKLAGIYSIYRRHSRELDTSIKEEILWIGFINGSVLPQALLITEDNNILVGEIVGSNKAWSIQFISLDAENSETVRNDALRIQRTESEVSPGLRTRISQNGSFLFAYRTILAKHPDTNIIDDKDPNLAKLIETYSEQVTNHKEGSPVHEKFFNLLEQKEDTKGLYATKGVMHFRGEELPDIKFDPTKP